MQNFISASIIVTMLNRICVLSFDPDVHTPTYRLKIFVSRVKLLLVGSPNYSTIFPNFQCQFLNETYVFNIQNSEAAGACHGWSY